jgi:hypothetical protein
MNPSPNFLIIGASRSGSTALQEYLCRHPDIYLKRYSAEPKFFSRLAEYSKGIDYYQNTYFADWNGESAVGEKSTEYIESEFAAFRISTFSPNMKIIYILRNPVERALSNYWWSVKNGFETRSPERAMLEEIDRAREPMDKMEIIQTDSFNYIRRSFYSDCLAPYYNLFPCQNILGVAFEEMINAPTRFFTSVFAFLGVDPKRINLNDGLQRHREAERQTDITPETNRALKQFLYDKNKELHSLTGIDFFRHWG